MLNIIYSIIFGIIEGITEWLPISSTGHLILAETFLKFQNISEEFWKLYLVVIQFGAILAVIVLFFKNIWPLKTDTTMKGKKVLRWDKKVLNLWLKIIIGCIPGVIIVLFKIDEYAEAHFENPLTIAIMLILVGVAFILVEKSRRKKFRVNSVEELTYKDAIIIGLFQVIAAIFPGTSRSGATIIGALLIGISRVAATEYTFYLAIPAMAGASLLKFLKYDGSLASNEIAILLIGVFVSFFASAIIIKFLMNYVKKHDFTKFGWYRIVVGIIVIILINTNMMSMNINFNNEIKEENISNYEMWIDGSKHNISQQFKKEKAYKGISFTNVELIEENEADTFIGTVKNNSGEDLEDIVEIEIILLNEEGKELGSFVGIIAPIANGESAQINSSVTLNEEFVNAYDYKIEEVRE